MKNKTLFKRIGKWSEFKVDKRNNLQISDTPNASGDEFQERILSDSRLQPSTSLQRLSLSTIGSPFDWITRDVYALYPEYIGEPPEHPQQ